jgi:hypothetical protein
MLKSRAIVWRRSTVLANTLVIQWKYNTMSPIKFRLFIFNNSYTRWETFPNLHFIFVIRPFVCLSYFSTIVTM